MNNTRLTLNEDQKRAVLYLVGLINALHLLQGETPVMQKSIDATRREIERTKKELGIG